MLAVLYLLLGLATFALLAWMTDVVSRWEQD